MVAKATNNATAASNKDKKKFKTLTIVLGVSAGVLLVALLLVFFLFSGKVCADESMDL